MEVKDKQIQELQQVTKELTKQNDQSERIIAQLQQTNSTLLLENNPSNKPKENKKESPIWWVLFLLLIVFVVSVGFYVFNILV